TGAQLPVPDVKLRRFAKPLMNISPGIPTSGLYPHPAERVTLRVTVVVRLKLLLTPVMVNVKVPLEALLAAFRVRVEEAAAAGLGLKLAVTPLGNPLTLRETVTVNPPVRVMFTEELVVPPRGTLWEAGLAAKLKAPAAGAVTTSVTEVVRVRAPLAPVMVSKELPVGVVAVVITVNVE